MIEQTILHILLYNIRHKALTIMASLLHDEKISQFNILAIQKLWYNPHNKSLYNPDSSSFYLAHKPKSNTHTCVYINKRLDLENWKMEESKRNLCSIQLAIKDKHLEAASQKRKIRIHNVYNLFLVFYTFNTSSLTLLRIKQALQKKEDHILLGDFNLHHLQWNNLGQFIYYLVADELISITQEKDLELALLRKVVT